MVLQHRPEHQLIGDALAAGHLTVADESGFHHGMYTVCSQDGVRAHPHRTVWKRDMRGHYIDHIIFRCFSCGRSWQASVEEIHLA
ncbi:MAG: hypothetical protein ACRDJE_21765 [Dehalococcoidia bacterium]